MPSKRRSRKKRGAGMFDFLKVGETKSYTKKRCKEYENEITKLEKRIDELKAKQEEYKCLGGDMMTDNPMQQPENEIEPEIEPQPEISEPNQVDEPDKDFSDEEEEEEPQMQPMYKNDAAVEGVLDEVNAPEDRKDDNKDSIAKTITKGLTGGRRRRRKSRRKSKRKSKKRRKSRKKKSRKRRRRKSRR